MNTKYYNRQQAVQYAKIWALKRNPQYANFDGMGGDCTNFASQCLYAGTGIMNYTPVYGWYYNNINSRAPAWTGVAYFYNFLIDNNSIGPQGAEVSIDELKLGDFIQLGHETGDFYHTAIVTGFSNHDILVSAHTYDVYNKPLVNYRYERIRGIHIFQVNIE